ncbi:hypothetical protein BCR36DRAFT_416126 [Piromyces finnis]|uniref:Uncharacterized protein n=1 Tax=Piromyces finnis TaxID=1754191 RepID=A0A1Y1UXE8_9FUNG|nr:hypothetical protein BCR36DRAFT_416126 [Piromyces finnis]|eukprot:ORX42377.1 hypothetical protein BCR36DRAFT_416126 [Piromyces finnis]
MGEYFTVVKSDKLNKRSDDNETKLDSDNNNDIKSDSTTANDKVDEKLIDKENEGIFRHRTLEEYKEYYKNLLDKLIKDRTNSVSLTSKNPAYNPYHPLLIHAENTMGPNVITILGAPYKEKKLNNFELQNDEDNDFRDCNISVNNMDKSNMTCAVAYTHNIQNTITISSSKGTAYHQDFGYSYGEGDAITDEIGSSLELARALARGSSVSYSKSEGGSVALENVHTVVNTESSSNTNSYDYTHTTTHDESYTFTVSEENSHSRSDGGEIVDESNWTSYNETSRTNEYTRMELDDYNKALQSVNADKRCKTGGSLGSSLGSFTGILGFIGGGAISCLGGGIAELAKGASQAHSAEEVNKIAERQLNQEDNVNDNTNLFLYYIVLNCF